MDRNAKINAYYISSQGKKHKVAEGIPYYLLDKLVSGLTKKYNITMNDIEVRPADSAQYRRTHQPEMAEGSLNEFAPGNGDDGIPHAEYVVYQCDPSDQFEFIGGPLYQTDNLGMAHKYAYEKYVKHRPKAFVIYQPHAEASRGNYGVKGQSDGTEDDMTESSDYLDEK
jgi:hypothetical protein